MGFPNSTEELDSGMLSEGYAEYIGHIEELKNKSELDFSEALELLEYEDREYQKSMQKRFDRLAEKGYGYYLDNCGDGPEYCKKCIQPECSKRLANCPYIVE